MYRSQYTIALLFCQDFFCRAAREDRIYFEGTELKTKEVWSIVKDGEPDAEYYIEGKRVTREEILKYFEDNPKTKVEFLPLEVSWQNNNAKG